MTETIKKHFFKIKILLFGNFIKHEVIKLFSTDYRVSFIVEVTFRIQCLFSHNSKLELIELQSE